MWTYSHGFLFFTIYPESLDAIEKFAESLCSRTINKKTSNIKP